MRTNAHAALAEPRIRRRDHCDLGDTRHAHELFLDFDRAHVLATADDDVLLAIGDREVPVGIEHADVARHEPAVGRERGGGELRVGVADEAFGPAAPDLARLARPGVVAVLVDGSQLDARQRCAVGEQPLLARRLSSAARDRRVLGRTEAAHGLDAQLLGALADRGRDRGTSESDRRHERDVPLRIEVGMVEQADEEVRRALAGRQAVFEHRREHARRVPDVDEMHRLASVHGKQQRGEHPDAVADRRANQRRRPGWLYCTELADLGADGAMGVHHPLGVGRRSRRVRDQRRGGRVDRERCRDRLVGNELVEAQVRAGVVADDRGPFELGEVGTHGVEIRDEVEVAEGIRGDERLHPRAPEDVRHLFGTVEVHDRHDDRAEVGDGPERRRRFHPVRQLERDRVARSDAAGSESGRDPPCERVDVAERAAVRPSIRTHRERLRGGVVQPGREHGAERRVVPEPLRDVAAREHGIDGAQREVGGFGHGTASLTRREIRVPPRLGTGRDASMPSRFYTLVVDARDPAALAQFWKDVLDWETTYESSDEVVIAKNGDQYPALLFGTVPEDKQIKNRLHIDLAPDDRDAEVERILALGATHADVGQGDDVTGSCSPIPRATSSACSRRAKAACSALSAATRGRAPR